MQKLMIVMSLMAIFQGMQAEEKSSFSLSKENSQRLFKDLEEFESYQAIDFSEPHVLFNQNELFELLHDVAFEGESRKVSLTPEDVRSFTEALVYGNIKEKESAGEDFSLKSETTPDEDEPATTSSINFQIAKLLAKEPELVAISSESLKAISDTLAREDAENILKKEKKEKARVEEIQEMVEIPARYRLFYFNDLYALEELIKQQGAQYTLLPTLPDPLILARMPGFLIALKPVNNKHYQRFIDDTGYPPPKHWKDGHFLSGTGDNPVVHVSFQDAIEYATWAGLRLPSELELSRAISGSFIHYSNDHPYCEWTSTAAKQTKIQKDSSRLIVDIKEQRLKPMYEQSSNLETGFRCALPLNP